MVSLNHLEFAKLQPQSTRKKGVASANCHATLPVMISSYSTETTRLICGSTKHGAKNNVFFCLRLFQFDENDSEPETCGAIQMFFLTYGTTPPEN